jgi:hypothetical protein
MDGWMDGWVDGWMDGWVDGWMDGCKSHFKDCLQQSTNEDGEERVIAYASRPLLNHEENFTPFRVEMQAMVWAMGHFDAYLRGRQFTLFTDYKTLETQSKHQENTLKRCTKAFLKYNFVIKYKKGSEMPTDFLSRNAIDAIGVFLDTNYYNNRTNFVSPSENACIPSKITVHANTWTLLTLVLLMVESCGDE